MSEQTPQVYKPKRLLFLDFIKFLIIVPGVTYHCTEYLNFPEHTVDLHWFINLFTTYSRIFYYTAFIATFCVFFAMGLRFQKKIFSIHRSILAFGGFLFLSYLYYDPENAPFFGTEWTFYNYTVTTLIFIHFLKPFFVSKKLNILVMIISASMLLIPFWSYDFSWMPIWLKVSLVGDCSDTLYGEWPMLPWFFLSSLTFSYAKFLHYDFDGRQISKVELAIWLIAIFSIGIPYWGGYFNQPTDIGYSCGVFAHPQLMFYAHFLPYLFILRLNYVQKVNNWLSTHDFFNSLKNLQWVDQFGATYLLSLITMGFLRLIYNGDKFDGDLRYFMFMASIMITLIAPELIMRSYQRYKSKH